jgi:hypothetical protein
MFLKATEATTRLQLLCTATIVNEDTVLSVVEDSRRDGNMPNFFETDSSQVCQSTISISGRPSQESSDFSLPDNGRLMDGTSLDEQHGWDAMTNWHGD